LASRPTAGLSKAAKGKSAAYSTVARNPSASYDNALAETINGLFKAEVIRKQGPWRSVEAVEFATLEWVDWFNNRRLFGSLGHVPPAEFEEDYYRRQDCQPRAA